MLSKSVFSNYMSKLGRRGGKASARIRALKAEGKRKQPLRARQHGK